MNEKINSRGNKVIYYGPGKFGATSRYKFDFHVCRASKGWIQYDTDQDAWYFGVWVNPERLEIMTYAEGDVSLVICKDKESYHAELKSMAKFYGDPPPAFTVLNPVTGEIKEYFDQRPV